MSLAGKTILLGVTGGIAAYKAAHLCSLLLRDGADVDVVMTEAAQRFLTPLTFETLTRRPVHTGMWDAFTPVPGHIALADRADLLVLAPATANTLAKYAHGIADNLLTGILLATTAPVLAAPAMNDRMLAHPATLANLACLRARGVHLLEPEEGRLACGTTGRGRMPEPETILAEVRRLLPPGSTDPQPGI